MPNDEYVKIDTAAFMAFISQKESLVKRYNEINTDYDKIVSTLLQNWSGQGANAFRNDANTIKANISGIYDILKIMCDTLVDCREVILECDRALGEYNRNPDSN